MSLSKKSGRTDRPIGLILPALVFGLGIVAMTIGIPKEMAVRSLTSSGVQAFGKVVSIQHTKGKEVDLLSFNVDSIPYTVEFQHDDKESLPTDKRGVPLVYLANNPKIATSSLAADTKLANEYLIAGILEIGVGGWILALALRQRRRLLLKAVAQRAKKSK